MFEQAWDINPTAKSHVGTCYYLDVLYHLYTFWLLRVIGKNFPNPQLGQVQSALPSSPSGLYLKTLIQRDSVISCSFLLPGPGSLDMIRAPAGWPHRTFALSPPSFLLLAADRLQTRLMRSSNRCHILMADVFSSLRFLGGKHGSDYSSSGHKHHIDLLSQISWTSITSLSSPFKVSSWGFELLRLRSRIQMIVGR